MVTVIVEIIWGNLNIFRTCFGDFRVLEFNRQDYCFSVFLEISA